MPKYLIATNLTETFRLQSGTTGETFTITNATKPNGTSWAGPDITEIGSGAYQLAFTPDTLGVWLATITGNTSGEVSSGSWEVVAAPTPVYERRITGAVIRSTDINELQIALEKAQKMLGLA